MNPVTSAGELLLGAVDGSKYVSPLYLFDLVSPGSWYSVYLTKISSSTGSTTGLSQVETVFDTTTDSIILPVSWSSSLKTIFKGDVDQNSTLIVPCTSTMETMDVVFFLGDGIPISIPLSAFLGEPTGTDGMCFSSISFSDTEQYVLGTSFMRYVYLVLNSDGSQGAVAQANFVESDSNLTSMTSNTPLPSAISFTSTINESNGTTISNSTDLGNGTAFNTQFVLLATTGQLITETIVTTITSEGSTSVLTTTVTSTVPTSKSTATLSSDLSASTSPTAPIVNFAVTTSVQVITETLITTITSDMSTSVFTTSLTSTMSSAMTTTTDPVSSDSVTTPVVDHAVSTSSTTNLGTTSTTTLPNFVVSVSYFTDSNSSQTATTITGSDSRTFGEVLASATTTSTGPPSNLTTASTVSIDTSTNPIVVNHIVSATTTDPVKDGTATTDLMISYGTYSLSTNPGASTTNPSVHGFNVLYTSTSPPSQSHASPWPSAPININIFVQNSILLTTTRNYVSDGSKDVLTVTSTATVTTTVPCSTGRGTFETLTAKVLQILIVPSPTPYLDPECTCTKSDITYVDDTVTKTIYVDDTTSSLDPTQHPYPTSDQSVCGCDNCYYTVKKTATVTMTCTAAPAVTSAASVPQFISEASSRLPAIKLVGILVIAIAMTLVR